MKKLVFTALAVVAFSGVSMAKETVEKVSIKKVQELVVFESDCTDRAIDAYERAIDRDNNGEDNLDLLHDFLSVCN